MEIIFTTSRKAAMVPLTNDNAAAQWAMFVVLDIAAIPVRVTVNMPNAKGCSRRAISALLDYHWPGNVRELENCIARAIILSKGSHLEIKDFPERVRSAVGHRTTDPNKKIKISLPDEGISIRDMERELITGTLEKCKGNKTLAASRLGISRKALYEKMERYKIFL